ncbi:MAG: hypothetical protein GY817_01110 [bacterium]|nr:hypothetical protein [bacterium]
MSNLAFTRKFKLIRHSSDGGYDGNGRYVKGSFSETNIEGSIQPMKERELLNLPEAQRTRGTIKIYTDVELKVVDTENNLQADRIEYNNFFYEVQEVNDYTSFNIPHYKSIAVKVPANEEARQAE